MTMATAVDEQQQQLKKGIAELYDESSGMWGNIWGEDMHPLRFLQSHLIHTYRTILALLSDHDCSSAAATQTAPAPPPFSPTSPPPANPAPLPAFLRSTLVELPNSQAEEISFQSYDDDLRLLFSLLNDVLQHEVGSNIMEKFEHTRTLSQDIMIRYNRMKGRPTLWLPGTDHAAIATQGLRGLTWVERSSQSEFGNGKKRAVIEALVKLHEKGLIFQGNASLPYCFFDQLP
ncbi:hypothetical protein L2E82_40024 [Cichorium intybus]|uniref:Uncharacterized protein n=1 Tax=Cichorium intybus TaxID=13427 RepID=A0ACB9AK59_CICIN|nr:hypothetical protein L2E82_40024 [Cichorium intybus]